MANEKSIIQEVSEVKTLLMEALAAIDKVQAHPAYKRVMDFGEHLEAFASGQPKPQAKAIPTRTRRTKAEIEAEKLAKVEAK